MKSMNIGERTQTTIDVNIQFNKPLGKKSPSFR